MKDTDRAAFESIKVGDIFVSSWGYDQTNVDFYKVVAKTAARIKVVKIGKSSVSGDGWSGKVVANPELTFGEPKLKTVTAGYREGPPGFSINTYSSASLWDGKPEYESSYA